ncbi:MAG: glutamate--tRNA ligase [Pseudomonadota bacterium]
MKKVKTRFAPSPTGLIHIGNVRTALFNALYAKKEGGVFVLRIEDTDRDRSKGEYVAALMEDLRWLGLKWGEGPASSEADATYFQSARGDIYAHYYSVLERAEIAYPCFCSPTELELSRKSQLGAGMPPRYSGKCANLSPAEAEAKSAQGLKPTLRFRVGNDEIVEFDDLVRGTQKLQTSDIGDFIIRRADGSPAFFFCNATDDALMDITHVLRGGDHLTNTPRQILLLKALGLPVPEYGHISLILGSDGSPLSKRHGSISIRDLRARGYMPSALVNLLARLGHYYENDERADLEGLANGFSLSGLGKAPARFDLAQLRHWQERVVRSADKDTLWNWLDIKTRESVPIDRREPFLDIVRSNCTFPTDAAEWASILFTDPLARDATVMSVATEAGSAFFRCALDAVERFPGEYEPFLDYLKKNTGAKGKALFQPLRASLTGRLDGPELAAIYKLLGKGRLERRLAEFI